MLFNSYAFVFAFLPLSLAIYHRLRRLGFDRGSIPALTLLSLLKGHSRADQNPAGGQVEQQETSLDRKAADVRGHQDLFRRACDRLVGQASSRRIGIKNLHFTFAKSWQPARQEARAWRDGIGVD